MTLAIALLLLSPPPPTFDDIVQTGLKDISFTMKLDWFDHSELRKINRDFATTYDAKNAEFVYKDPLMLRCSAEISGQKVVYVIAGDKKTYKVPRLGVKASQDVGKGPGKRQTLLDFGIISPGMRDKFLSGSFVRKDPTGQLVFDLKYQWKADTSRFRVWADPVKRIIVKKLWYNQQGQLMALFDYSGHTQVGGVWFPTKMQVTNAEGKVGGKSSLGGFKVNTGPDDSVFRL